MRAGPDAAQVLVVRHGQSVWNAERRWQGDLDPPLSPLGVQQARAAARHLGAFDVVASSPLSRARVTASIIGGELGLGPVHVEADLRERHAGAFQGLTGEEIDDRFPGYREANRRPPGWEPDDVVVARAAAALGRIAARAGGGSALVVTHGGVITCLEAVLAADRSGSVPNLAGRWFEIGPTTLVPGDSVELLDPDIRTVPTQL